MFKLTDISHIQCPQHFECDLTFFKAVIDHKNEAILFQNPAYMNE